jgi:anti-sigma B factor antagonist
MIVSERAAGETTIVDLQGKLIAGVGAERLRDKLQSLLQQGRRQFVVNLGEVPYMDSTGLGELVHAYATVARQGGALKLLNATTRLRDLLVITKLVSVFECFDHEAEALASFVVHSAPVEAEVKA